MVVELAFQLIGQKFFWCCVGVHGVIRRHGHPGMHAVHRIIFRTYTQWRGQEETENGRQSRNSSPKGLNQKARSLAYPAQNSTLTMNVVPIRFWRPLGR